MVTEIDSTYLKAQQRGRGARGHFRAHFRFIWGYTTVGESGAIKSAVPRGAVEKQALGLKHRSSLYLWAATGLAADASFSKRRFRGALERWREGLKWVRQREFAQSYWLLDRWHIAQNVARWWAMMNASSAALWQRLEERQRSALRSAAHSAYAKRVQLEFNALFGYILGNRDGIDNWHLIPRFTSSLPKTQDSPGAHRQRSD